MLNKTFRLFISSTFSDFLFERQELNEKVFFAVDTFCQERGYNFQIIDLRWGVNTESALNQNTMNICLTEVTRCRTLSPRPNLLIMAGERYGWIPLPSEMSSRDYAVIAACASKEEMQLLSEWYLFDENEIGGKYYLKERTGEYADYEVWESVEGELHRALRNCIEAGKDVSDMLRRTIYSSATEQEIIEGLLEHEDIGKNTIALFRTGFPEKDSNPEKADNLKQKIVEKMTADGNEDNILTLKWGKRYRRDFSKIVTDVIIRNITEEMERLRTVSDTTTEKQVLLPLLESPIVFVERNSLREELSAYISGDGESPLFLSGESGSGKSTLLAEFISGFDGNVFFSFYGIADTYTLVDSLRSLAEQVKKRFGTKKSQDISTLNLSEALIDTMYSVPEEHKALFVIDGLDMFHDIRSINEQVFPSKLPENIKLVVSAANGEVLERFHQPTFRQMSIASFSSEESLDHLNSMLNKIGRRISSPEQNQLVSAAIENGTTPLQLRLITEICSRWRSADRNLELPDSPEHLALKQITDMYTKFGHNQELVLYAMALIAASPFGVTEDELQVLLLRFDSVQSYFVTEDRYNHDLTRLPFVIWSRLFYDLKGCLTLSVESGHIVVKFSHGIFHYAFVKNFSKYYTDAVNELIAYYSAQKNYISDSKAPNRRKAMILPVILVHTGQYSPLIDLYSDLTFIDAAVKNGDVDDIIAALRFLSENTAGDHRAERLGELYLCLSRSRDTLNCYYDQFVPIAAGYGMTKGRKIIKPVATTGTSDVLFFPYSLSSRLVWFNEDIYAAYYNSYIYVYNFSASVELCKIYLAPESSSQRDYVRRMIWLDEKHIAVLTHSNQMLIFDLNNRIPHTILEIDVKTENTCLCYYSPNSSIIFQEEASIRSCDIYSGTPIWQFDLTTAEQINFHLDESVLVVRDSRSAIKVVSAENGQQLRLINTKQKGDLQLLPVDEGEGIYQLGEDRWLNYLFGLEIRIRIYAADSPYGKYLIPPEYNKMIGALVSRNSLLLVYPDKLVSVDLQNDYEMSWLPMLYPNVVSWIVDGESISVIDSAGLRIVKISDFLRIDQAVSRCFCCTKNIASSVSLINFRKSMDGMRKMFRELYPETVRKPYNLYEYDVLFSNSVASFYSSTTASDNSEKKPPFASIVCFAEDGKIAAAYEDKNTVVVFDPEQRPLIRIDKLRLSLTDGILKMVFSPDSRKLLIWRNRAIMVIDIYSGKTTKLDLSKRPALNVNFGTNSSEIVLVLWDKKQYTVRTDLSFLQRLQQGSDIPRELPSAKAGDSFYGYSGYGTCGPYTYYRRSDNFLARFRLLDEDGFDPLSHPSRWFRDRKVYNGEEHWLYFSNGEFYLNGDDDKTFSHSLIDFMKSSLIERLSEAVPLRCYLKEKNDLFSALTEIAKNRLILISRALRSVIVFDLDSMKVLEAIKADGNIIGCKVDRDRSGVLLVIDKPPYYCEYSIEF